MTTGNGVNNTHSKHIMLHLPSVLGYEKIARRAAEAVAEDIDLPPDRIEDLKTAVAEACMNAIEHGNQLEVEQTVTVQIVVAAHKLEVAVADVGLQPFPDDLPRPGSNYRSWGMFFIKQLVDEVVVVPLPEGGTQVRMAIYFAPPDQGRRSAAVQPVDPKPGAILPAEDVPRTILPVEPAPRAIQLADPRPGAILPAEPKPGAILPSEPGAAPAQEK